MSDRLTAGPGTLEFLRQLLEITQESDHPMDKALAERLTKLIRGALHRISQSWQLEDGLDAGKWPVYPPRERTLHEIIDDLWPIGETPGHRCPLKYDIYLQRQKRWRQEHSGWSREE